MEWIKGISPIEFPGLGISIDPAAGVRIGSLSINFCFRTQHTLHQLIF